MVVLSRSADFLGDVVETYRCASRLPIEQISIDYSGKKHSVHTTVSVTKGVGVQPRAGVRSSEGLQLEKDREAMAGRNRDTGERGIARPSR